MRTSTLILHRSIQGESHIDFFGESEGSLPPLQDSLPDAGEAINDFWSMSGNFIFRHLVEPRVKLYSPLFLQEREEPANLRQNLSLSRRKVSCQLSPSHTQVRGDPCTNLVRAQKIKSRHGKRKNQDFL